MRVESEDTSPATLKEERLHVLDSPLLPHGVKDAARDA
jgi:hypothetical protein